MNVPQVGSRDISSPSMRMQVASAAMPSQTDLHCTVHTDRTSVTKRLNSSKQTHAPLDAMPLKMLPRRTDDDVNELGERVYKILGGLDLSCTSRTCRSVEFKGPSCRSVSGVIIRQDGIANGL